MKFRVKNRLWDIAISNENFLGQSPLQPDDKAKLNVSGYLPSAQLAVEVRRLRGSPSGHALLVGSLVQSRLSDTDSAHDLIIIESSGDITYGAEKKLRGLLDRQLVAGIPGEFISGIKSGIALQVPAVAEGNYITIQSGGYDEVESNSMGFKFAADILVRALILYRDNALTKESVEEILPTERGGQVSE